MKRASALGALVALVFVGILPAHAKPNSTYALAGEGRALEVALGTQGVTLGFAIARADSTPKAVGVGAGQCTILADDPDPDALPCEDSSTVKTKWPESPGDGTPKCASPAIPDPLGSVLTLELACGTSQSSLTKGHPQTTNQGKVGELALDFDLSGLIPQVQDAKKQLIDQLQDLIGQAPKEIQNALDQLLDALDVGQAIQVVAGPSSSNITSKGDILTVNSTAAGARIGVVGIPDLDDKGEPIPGTAQAIDDGLLIVEIGSAASSASVNKTTAAAESAASAAVVTLKVRDITKPEPTYIKYSVAPGETITVLEDTPAESTIIAADTTTEEKQGTARAASAAVGLHLLKGIQGGLRVAYGRTTAAASVDVARAAPPAPPPAKKVLPVTGGSDWTLLGVALMAAAGALFVMRRVLASRSK